MADTLTFQCPSCAAVLHAPGNAATVTCEYCGNTVAVPASLRPPPAYIPPPPAYVPPPAPTYVLAPSGTARTISILGILGLILSCFLWPFGSILCVIALVMAWQYNQQPPGAVIPRHPDDAGRVRTGLILATIGLALTVGLCLFVLGLSGLGWIIDTTLTPTPLP